MQILVKTTDGDQAAGQLLEVLGLDHIDQVGRIVAVRMVCPHAVPVLCFKHIHFVPDIWRHQMALTSDAMCLMPDARRPLGVPD